MSDKIPSTQIVLYIDNQEVKSFYGSLVVWSEVGKITVGRDIYAYDISCSNPLKMVFRHRTKSNVVVDSVDQLDRYNVPERDRT